MYKVKAVGSSYHRQAIEQIARNPDGLRALVFCAAYLVPEDNNEHDAYAVKVVVEGRVVGHLAKDYARTYRSFFSELQPPVPTTVVSAAITGGLRVDGREYEYSVELDIPDSLEIYPMPGPPDEQVVRVNGFPLPVHVGERRYEVKVWVPVADWDELHRTRSVLEWTTDSWSTVNFYAENRQRVGLGYKLYELPKGDYERYFGSGPVDCELLLGSNRFATLRMQGSE